MITLRIAMRRLTAAVTVVFLSVGLLSVGLFGVIPAGAEVQNNPVFPALDCGGEWHWVHNQLPDGVESGTLTVVFEGVAPIELAGEFNGSVMHYYLVLGGGATLVSASDDIDGGMLVLSHWPDCSGTTTTTDGDTSSTSSASTSSSSTSDTSTSTSSTSSTSSTVQGTTSSTGGDTTATTAGAESPTTVTTPPDDSATTVIGLTTTTTTTADSEDLGSLRIVKLTTPSAAPGRFVFLVIAESGERRWTVVLEAGESATIDDLEAGIYSVVERLPIETDTISWELISFVCDDGSLPSAVGIGEGETVTCEATNEVTEVFETTVTTIPPVTATTLPFTGFDIARISLIGLALAATGALVLSTVSSRRRSA